MRHLSLKAALLVAALLSTSTARADFVKGTTGLSTFANQLLFPLNAFPTDTIITTQFASQGVTFTSTPSTSGSSGGLVYNNSPSGGIPNLDPAYLVNYTGANVVPPPYTFNLFFTEDQMAVSFVMATVSPDGGTISMSALNNGIAISSVFMAAPSGLFDTANVYTVTSGGTVGGAFDQIQITLNQATSDATMGLDDIRLGTFTPPAGVPEPGSFVLGGVATLLVSGFAWRRRRAKVVA